MKVVPELMECPTVSTCVEIILHAIDAPDTLVDFRTGEHSSFPELKAFVTALCPREVVPTVNASTRDRRDKLRDLFSPGTDLKRDKGRMDAYLKGGALEAVDVQRQKRLLASFSKDSEVEVDPEATQDAESDAQRLGAVLDDVARFGDTTGHLFCFSPEGRAGRITSHLLDPGLVSGPVLNASAGAVLMSGTLYPPSMYADLLSLPVKRTTIRSYPSPFAAQRRPVVVATDVTSTYRQRSPANTARMQEHLRALIQAAPGHVAVFAPSYALLEEIVTDAHWPVHRTIVESSDWDKSKADEVLDILERERDAGRKVLLAGTFGARLSEGVDYRGGLLDAVACIGLPIAPPGVVQDGLKAFVAERFGKDKSWRWRRRCRGRLP